MVSPTIVPPCIFVNVDGLSHLKIPPPCIDTTIRDTTTPTANLEDIWKTVRSTALPALVITVINISFLQAPAIGSINQLHLQIVTYVTPWSPVRYQTFPPPSYSTSVHPSMNVEIFHLVHHQCIRTELGDAPEGTRQMAAMVDAKVHKEIRLERWQRSVNHGLPFFPGLISHRLTVNTPLLHIHSFSRHTCILHVSPNPPAAREFFSRLSFQKKSNFPLIINSWRLPGTQPLTVSLRHCRQIRLDR